MRSRAFELSARPPVEAGSGPLAYTPLEHPKESMYEGSWVFTSFPELSVSGGPADGSCPGVLDKELSASGEGGSCLPCSTRQPALGPWEL